MTNPLNRTYHLAQEFNSTWKRYIVSYGVVTIIMLTFNSLNAQVIHENTVWTTSTTTTHNYNFTVGAGPERLLLVGVSVFKDYSNRSVTSMTYNGVAMTFQTKTNSPDDKVGTEIWYMINPPSGTHTLSTTLNTSTAMIQGITSLEGVDQTTPISVTGIFAQNSGNPSVTIASEIGGLVWDVVTRDNNGSWTPGALQTERWDTSSGSDLTSAGSTEPGAVSVTMSWTSDDSGQQVAQIAAAIKPSNSPPEICGNSIDDNNDGRTDENIPGGVGENLLLWLKADVGFSPPNWDDQGPKNNDGTIYGNPTQVSNSLNFNPAINFDGDDHVEVDLPELIFESGYHHAILFAVYTPSTPATTIGILGNETPLAGNNIGIRDNQIMTGWWTNPVVNEPQYFGSTPHLICLQIDEEDNVGGAANSSAAYLNGTLLQNFFFDEQGAVDVDSDLHIGRTGTHANSKYFQGDIHEIIVYYEWDGNAALTNSEIEQVQSYLATKYGITLSHDYSDSQ